MLRHYLSLVKFSHTVFALPFALVGFFLGVVARPEGMSWRLFGLVVLCMVFARSAAMAFNRWLDRDIDAVNPRTRGREIPAGVVSARSALLFTVLMCVLFVSTTWLINPLCFYLSPVALLVVLGYSYTKRFTWLCHAVLGLGLGLAPVGAYLAATGQFGWASILYGLAVLTWTAGFDIIYALQDEAFDKENNLYSVPAWLGKKRALRVSEWLHLGTAALMILALRRAGFETEGATYWVAWVGTLFFLLLLIYQHLLVKPDDLSRVNLAFFTTNGVASVLFGAMMVGDLVIW